MSKNNNILLAGFGGQGILFTGKVIAYAGMIAGREVSWLPSYGPEMRGGTANCSVILSDSPIGSPIVTNPDILMALNIQSFEKFEPSVTAGGVLVADSSLIPQKSAREDITACYIPATRMTSGEGCEIPGLANMVALGQMIKATGFVSLEVIEQALKKSVPPRKADLLELNIKAIRAGYEYSF